MRKICFLLVVLICSTLSAKSEVFLDYVPENVPTQAPVVKSQSVTSTTVTQPTISKTQVKPQVTQTKSAQPKQTQTITSSEIAPVLPTHLKNSQNYSASTHKIQKRKPTTALKGTNFLVKSSQKISDWSVPNTKVTFVTTRPQSTGGIILPAGTVFKGHIISSHRPQLTSNGGMVKFSVDEVIYQNIANDFSANVVSVNGKKIYFNTIKGQRRYWKNTCRNASWGTKMCKKGAKCTSRLSRKGGVYWILTPFPVLGGSLAWCGNAIVAPVIATFQKGGSVSFKAGTMFFIQLQDNAQIYVLE